MKNTIKNTAMPMKERLKGFGLIAIVAVILILGMTAMTASNVSASFVEIDLNRLVDKADYIVIGIVKDMKSAWCKKDYIYTNVTIVVKKIIKGKKILNEITVRKEGGEIGSGDNFKRLWVTTEPKFTLGEEVLLFLSEKKRGKYFTVSGHLQGKYTIERNIAKNRDTGRNINIKVFIDIIRQGNKNLTYEVVSTRADSINENVRSATTSTSSNCYVYAGKKWFQWPWPFNNVVVDFYKNRNLPTNWVNAINRGAQAWNGVSKFRFRDRGSTPTNCASNDNVNAVCRAYIDGWGGTLAVARIRSGWFVDEVDTIFDTSENWYAGTGTCPSNRFDVWNVATHEFGHWLVLDHPNNIGPGCNQESMWGSTTFGETLKRDIHHGDIAGIRHIYGQ